MIRLLAIAALVIGAAPLAGCAPDGEANPGRYTLGRGGVNYDELRRAREQCVASGGTVEFKGAGGDQYQMSNYVCVIGRKPAAAAQPKEAGQ